MTVLHLHPTRLQADRLAKARERGSNPFEGIAIAAEIEQTARSRIDIVASLLRGSTRGPMLFVPTEIITDDEGNKIVLEGDYYVAKIEREVRGDKAGLQRQ